MGKDRDKQPECTAMVPRDFTEMTQMAAEYAKSSLLPPALVRNPANTLFAMSYGAELGLPPMTAIRSIHVIEGRPALSADAKVAIVLRSGQAEYFHPVEQTAEKATWVTKRKGHKHESKYTFTLAEAKAGGIMAAKNGGIKDNWRKWPGRMISARAKSFLASDIYPDIVGGIYSPEELEDSVPSSPEVVDDVVVADAPEVQTAAATESDEPPPPDDEPVYDAEFDDEPATQPPPTVEPLESLIGERGALNWLKSADATVVAQYDAEDLAVALRKDLKKFDDRAKLMRWIAAAEKHTSPAVGRLIQPNINEAMKNIGRSS